MNQGTDGQSLAAAKILPDLNGESILQATPLAGYAYACGLAEPLHIPIDYVVTLQLSAEIKFVVVIEPLSQIGVCPESGLLRLNHLVIPLSAEYHKMHGTN